MIDYTNFRVRTISFLIIILYIFFSYELICFLLGFHVICTESWLSQDDSLCPICRKDILSTPATPEESTPDAPEEESNHVTDDNGESIHSALSDRNNEENIHDTTTTD